MTDRRLVPSRRVELESQIRGLVVSWRGGEISHHCLGYQIKRWIERIMIELE